MMFPKPAPRIKPPRARLGKRKEARRSGRDRDPVFLAKVRRLPCACIKAFPGHVCEGRVEADHMGPRPLGRKCHDHESGPMCQRAHWERTNYVGLFKNFTAVDMRWWCDDRIAETRTALGWKPHGPMHSSGEEGAPATPGATPLGEGVPSLPHRLDAEGAAKP